MNVDFRMKMRPSSLAWILLGMLAFQSSDASAQESGPPAAVSHHLGPLYISPMISLRNLGIDSNVYNDDGNPTKDFAFTLVPAFTATVGRRRARLDLRSTTELVYFAEQRSERSVNEDFGATARVTLGRIVPVADFGYLNTRERVSQEVDERARRIEHRGVVGVDVNITPKLSAVVRGEVARTRFNAEGNFSDRQLARQLNRDTPIVSAGLRYVVTPLTSVAVTTDVSRVRFTESPIKDTDSHLTQGSVEFSPRALVSGSARLGYQSFQLLSAEVPDFGGLVGSGNLAYRLSPSTALGFSFDRSLSYSFLPAQPYYLRQGYGLHVRRQIVPQWSLTVSGERYQHQYQSRQVELALLDEQAERVLGVALTLGYDIGPRTRFTTGLSYQYRQSDFENRSYDGLRVGTSIVHAF
jgi:hypothetical protein